MNSENLKNKEEQIYNKLIELKNGTLEERKVAFKCTGILGNESTTESFESRLKIVEDLINTNCNSYFKK